MEFHHIGIACKNIETETRHYALLNYHKEGDDFIDPNQGVTGRFLVGGGPRLELLSQIEGSSTLGPWLNSGIKMYHHAYLTNNMESAINKLVLQRARLVTPPTPAVAFNGNNICFLMLPTMSLIELIEMSRNQL